MGIFANMFKNKDDDLEAIEAERKSYQSLCSSLESELRTLESDLKRTLSPEENSKRPPKIRSAYIRRARNISRNIAFVTKFLYVFRRAESTCHQLQTMAKTLKDIEGHKGYESKIAALQEKMAEATGVIKSLSDQLFTAERNITDLTQTLDKTMFGDGDTEEDRRLDELYEKFQTLSMKGDAEGAAAVQAEIEKLQFAMV
jgi:chromosome segregation ATPase